MDKGYDKFNIAGVSFKGGHRDKFFFCHFEYFKEEKRWFLTSLKNVSEEKKDGNEAIKEWIKNYNIKKLVIDIPLTTPSCDTCTLECPGVNDCIEENVAKVNSVIDSILKFDEKNYSENPKQYERDRLEKETYKHIESSSFLASANYLISKSFKRRLNKGFIPYWNRSIDVWIWSQYYDQMLKHFKSVYDSFGQSSFLWLSRFKYIKRHLPAQLEFFESNNMICLLELVRAKIINYSHISDLSDLENGPNARYEILKKIETKLGVFIYDKDLSMLVTNIRAFDSFLLALAGQRLIMDNVREVPDWVGPNSSFFLAPYFNVENEC